MPEKPSFEERLESYRKHPKHCFCCSPPQLTGRRNESKRIKFRTIDQTRVMKKFLNILTSILLLFNAAGALYGGWNLMLYPDGTSIQLSIDWLKHAPFVDYRIPGFILFTTNGMFSAFVFMALILNLKKYAWLVMAQGTILIGWILIQILLIQTLFFLHFICLFVGIVLIIAGWMAHTIQPKASLKPVI